MGDISKAYCYAINPANSKGNAEQKSNFDGFDENCVPVSKRGSEIYKAKTKLIPNWTLVDLKSTIKWKAPKTHNVPTDCRHLEEIWDKVNQLIPLQATKDDGEKKIN